jgi:hypothetical protein
LLKHNRSTALEKTEKHHAPKHPRQFQYFLQFKLFILLREFFARSRIWYCFEIWFAVASEEVEYHCHEIREKIHKDCGPENPGKSPVFLAIMLAVDLPTKPPI